MMVKKIRPLFLLLLLVLFALFLSACGAKETSDSGSASGGNGGEQQASADPSAQKEGQPASKFPERDIEFVVGYNPGGGYSDWAQAIAPFIEKHLPNKVSVLVRHMPGAGSVTAANYVQKAKPDGYTIGIYNLGGLAATQIARDVDYDLAKVTWLARLSLDPTIATVNAKSSYKSIQDFKGKDKVIMSTKGLAANATITGAITFDKLGVKWQPLNHDGTSETILSVIRGDADVTWGSLDSQRQYLDNGDLRMILYYGAQRHPDFPDVPIPSEAGLPVELNEAFNTHRLIGAPPGLPEDVRQILEEAIRKAVEDPEFQEILQKMKLSGSSYLNGADTEKLVDMTLKGYEEYKDVVQELMSKEK
ncbi:tripartite tricarboxylate transporter substrate binding protein [Bacillaceae bacterium]